MVGRIYKQDLYALPHTKHESSAQVHYKTKIVRCTNVLMRIIDLLIMY